MDLFLRSRLHLRTHLTENATHARTCNFISRLCNFLTINAISICIPFALFSYENMIYVLFLFKFACRENETNLLQFKLREIRTFRQSRFVDYNEMF